MSKLILVLVLLTSCVSARLESWIGEDRSKLISTNGTPTYTSTDGEWELIVYEYGAQSYYAQPLLSGAAVIVPVTKKEVYKFVLHKQKIIAWQRN